MGGEKTPTLLLLVALAAGSNQLHRHLAPQSLGQTTEFEAQTALALVSPLLVSGGGHGEEARLVVLGDCRWLGGLLRGLPPSASVVLADTKQNLPLGLADVLGTLFLVLVDDVQGLVEVAQRLQLPVFARTILWTSSGEATSFNEERVRWSLAGVRYYQAVVVFASADGGPRVHALLFDELGLAASAEVAAFEGNRWLGSAALFPKPCWAEPATGRKAPYTVAVHDVTYDPHLQTSPLPGLIEDLKRWPNLHFTRTIQVSATRGPTSWSPHLNCNIDMFVYPSRFPLMLFKGLQEYVDKLSFLIVVVPSGMGRHHFFDRLSAGLAPALWLSLLGAVLLVAAVLVLLGGSPAEALTMALAPLLGQPVPEGRTARRTRPVLGSWLLASLVLSAAYSGQLLGVITVPHRAEIDSIEELVDSDLTIFVPRRLAPYAGVLLMAEDRLRFSSEQSVRRRWIDLLAWRNCALVMLDMAEPMLAPWLAKPSPIHLLRLPGAQVPFSTFSTRVGSLLWDAAVKSKGRQFASGIAQVSGRMSRAAALRLSCPGSGCPETDGPEPISMANVAPAGAVLVLGLCLATTAFVVEMLGAVTATGWVPRQRHRPPYRP